MKVRAIRGVCVGVNRHLKPGDIEEVDTADLPFLTGIGAVEVVKDAPELKHIAPELKHIEKEPKYIEKDHLHARDKHTNKEK